MKSTWQVQDAKNRFSELIEDTINKGPQVVTRHGKPVVRLVAVSAREARGLMDDDGFTNYLLKAPQLGELSLPARRNRRKPVSFGTA